MAATINSNAFYIFFQQTDCSNLLTRCIASYDKSVSYTLNPGFFLTKQKSVIVG